MHQSLGMASLRLKFDAKPSPQDCAPLPCPGGARGGRPARLLGLPLGPKGPEGTKLPKKACPGLPQPRWRWSPESSMGHIRPIVESPGDASEKNCGVGVLPPTK